jgi:drug/metabolite transporter (DMT)-like permease
MTQMMGAAIALAAALAYSIAVGLQAFEARKVPAQHALRLSLLRRLLPRPLWVTGALVGVLGWSLQAVALMAAPLTLVEPILATTLIFLVIGSRRLLGEDVGRREVVGALCVAIGIAGLAVGTPERTATHSTGATPIITLACLAAVVALPHARRGRRLSGTLIAASAGVAYAFVALVTKFLADDVSGGSIPWRSATVWVGLLAVLGTLGMLSEMSALQRWPVSQVAPIVFGLNVALPVLLAPAVAGEAWNQSPAVRTALVISLAAVVAGVVTLTRSKALVTVLGAEPARRLPQGLPPAAAVDDGTAALLESSL